MESFKPSVYGLLLSELESFCRAQDQPSFRAKQIWNRLYGKRISSIEEISNLPKKFRQELTESFSVRKPEILETKGASGETRKLLLKLEDGQLIESVIIPAPLRQKNTVCLSSQVGCRYGCAFCASGQKGLFRNLTAGEIVGQLLAGADTIGKQPNNVVFMGIGEPFDNYDEVLRSIRIINHPDGPNIGARRITLSTCGVIPGIQKLAEEGLQVELSVSLHAAEEETRLKFMPVNAGWPLDDLLAACSDYTKKTKRIITFEYTLIQGINDSGEQAQKLARRLTFPCRINLIPLSPVAEFEGKPSAPAAARRFSRILEKAGINTTLRDSKGSRLKAACGQLRADRSIS